MEDRMVAMEVAQALVEKRGIDNEERCDLAEAALNTIKLQLTAMADGIGHLGDETEALRQQALAVDRAVKEGQISLESLFSALSGDIAALDGADREIAAHMATAEERERTRWETTAQNVGELTRRIAEVIGAVHDIRRELASHADLRRDLHRDDYGSAYFSAHATRRPDPRDDESEVQSIAGRRRFASRFAAPAHTPGSPADITSGKGASTASTIPTGGRAGDKKLDPDLLQPVSLATLLAEASETDSPTDGPRNTLKTWVSSSTRRTRTTLQHPPVVTEAVPFPALSNAGIDISTAMRAFADHLDAQSGRGSVAAPSVDGDGRSISGSRDVDRDSGFGGGGGDEDGGGGGGGGGGGNGPQEGNVDRRAVDTPKKGFDSGFDVEGFALTPLAVSLSTCFKPITIETGNLHELWRAGKSLADRIRVKGIAARQKQKWEGLQHLDDFGCIWFEETVDGVCDSITGSHPLVADIKRNATQWIAEGQKLVYMRDRPRFEWFMAQVNLYFEGTLVDELIADLHRVSIPTGATLRDFLAYYTMTRATILSLSEDDDGPLVRCAVSVIRRQFPTLSIHPRFEPIAAKPKNYTSADIIAVLSPLISGGHRATAQENPAKYPLYPADFKRIDVEHGGAIPSSTPTTTTMTPHGRPTPRPVKFLNTIVQVGMACYEICALTDRRNDRNRPPLDCYNCKGPHAFVDCQEKLNTANWAAVAANRPYVGNFAPSDEQQFADLRKRVRNSINSRSYRNTKGVPRPPALP
jgi:hypothetical protein